MGLFDMFKKKAEPAAPAAPAKPAAVSVAPEAGTVYAPVSGRAVALAAVPDPVFSTEVLGKGCAIWPNGDTVYAPVSGTVTVTMGHAVGIAGEDGTEVLVHVGIDTVSMEGKGFEGFVSQGDTVKAGEPVLKFDSAAIEAAGYKDCVMLIVSNSAEFATVDMKVAPESQIEAGAAALAVAK